MMLFTSKQVSLPKISSILQKIKIGPKCCIHPFCTQALNYVVHEESAHDYEAEEILIPSFPHCLLGLSGSMTPHLQPKKNSFHF